MTRAVRSVLARVVPLGLAPVVLAGCYTYVYAPATPAPGQYVSVDLNDRGRVALEQNVGPSIARVEGPLEQADDSVLTLRVSRTIGLRGESNRWNGELVTMRREHAGLLRERRLSTGRTVALAGSLAVGLVAFAATQGLMGGSSGGIVTPPPPPPGGQ